MMYCPKCGKENSDDARFCMHCGADLSGYKVEISPKIEVSPKIETKFPSREKEKCAICGEEDAVVICPKCDRRVCNYHFEDEAPYLQIKPSLLGLDLGSSMELGLCTKCAIVEANKIIGIIEYQCEHKWSSEWSELKREKIPRLHDLIDEWLNKLSSETG